MSEVWIKIVGDVEITEPRVVRVCRGRYKAVFKMKLNEELSMDVELDGNSEQAVVDRVKKMKETGKI